MAGQDVYTQVWRSHTPCLLMACCTVHRRPARSSRAVSNCVLISDAHRCLSLVSCSSTSLLVPLIVSSVSSSIHCVLWFRLPTARAASTSTLTYHDVPLRTCCSTATCPLASGSMTHSCPSTARRVSSASAVCSTHCLHLRCQSQM